MASLNKLFACTVLILAAWNSCGTYAFETTTSAAFRYHLENTMKGFETWLRSAEDIDPTPLTPIDRFSSKYITKNLFTISYELKNEQLTGYLQNVRERLIDYIYVDLTKLQFSIGMTTTGNFTFQGDYSATGEVKLATRRPISGYGQWNISCSSISQQFNATFGITPEEYIFLKHTSQILSVNLEMDQEKTFFEGLWDNSGAAGFGPEIQKQMSIEMQNRYNEWYTNHPTGKIMFEFLNTTLSTTPLEQILSTKDPNA